VNATKTTGTTRRRPWLVFAGGVVAVSAVALATGLIDMGEAITDRIPFHSTLFGGLAPALVVALPMAIAAYLAATGAPRAAQAAMVAGALLVGWIVVQVLIIRTFSWLQPAMALAGAVVFLAGWLPRRRSER
jgi:hypothetical protein